MPWVPIEESGLNVPFTASGGAGLSSSVVYASDIVNSAWAIQNLTGADLQFRVTAQSYNASGGTVGTPARFDWYDPDSVAQQVENAGGPSSFSPAQFSGTVQTLSGYVTYTGAIPEGCESDAAESFSFLIELWSDNPSYEGDCAEYGRTTRAYVSGYNRSRVSVGQLRRREKRCVVANFNGAIPPSRTIVSATWRANSPWVTFMSNARISTDKREATVMVDFQNPGWGWMRCEVTLDNGEIYNQVFDFTVRDTPWFSDEVLVTSGPYSLTVVA